MTEVIVTGGRGYKDKERVYQVLDTVAPDRIIQGGCSGADYLASQYAHDRGLELVTYTANWGYYGKQAGPRRNKSMLEGHPKALVVIFPGGRGTDHCAALAASMGMNRYLVDALTQIGKVTHV